MFFLLFKKRLPCASGINCVPEEMRGALLGKMDIDDFLTVVPIIICKNVLLVYSNELICQTRPDPRLPIIKCLHTITYPAISWCIKNQPDGWSSMGDAQAELIAACRRAGLGSWAGAPAGQQVSVAYQSAGGVMGRWGGGHKFGVLSVNSWVCAPSHTELV